MQQKINFSMNIKRFFLAIILSFICGLTFAQDQLFSQFEEEKGVSLVYISPAMFKLMPKKDVGDISSIASKMTKLQILECERPSLIPSIKKKALECYQKQQYEVVMKAKDDDDRTTIYQKALGKGKNEFVLFTEEKDGLTIIQVVGNISLNDIKDLKE